MPTRPSAHSRIQATDLRGLPSSRGPRQGQAISAGAARAKASGERDLVKATIQLINARGGFAWRNQSAVTVIESKGRRRAIHSGRKGLPDVIGVLPHEFHHRGVAGISLGVSLLGRLIAVECKRPGNKPTAIQEATMAELRKRGALVVVAYSITDVEKALA